MRAGAASIGLLLLAYVLSPYISIFNLYVALASSDQESVRERVLWDPVRERLSRDLDRFAQVQANQLLNKEGVSMSWDSASLAEEVTAKLATPEGLISLFHHPAQMVGQLRRAFDKGGDPLLTPRVEKKTFTPEAPNIEQLANRLRYAFFTGLSSFRLSFAVGDLSFTLLLERYGLSWKVAELQFLT